MINFQINTCFSSCLAGLKTSIVDQKTWSVPYFVLFCLGQIGMVGFALEQTISMINFIAQLRGDVGTKNVDRLERN